MSESKPRFRPNGPEPKATDKKEAPKRPMRKEIAVVWEKETTDGEKYLNIKVTLPDGKEMWLKAFKNKFKKAGENHKPEYVAFENKGATDAT
jgi:hypothetical protein